MIGRAVYPHDYRQADDTSMFLKDKMNLQKNRGDPVHMLLHSDSTSANLRIARY
jgi:hypothetical protein